MYKWQSGDYLDEELLEKFNEYVFTVKGKGQALQCQLKVAMGERDEGKKMMQEYVKEASLKEDDMRKAQNLKWIKQLESGRELLAYIDQNPQEFSQNFSVPSGHENKIEHIGFSRNSNYFVTTSKECVKAWNFDGQKAVCYVTVPE